tara:strand:+ start:166 stop:1377 length:1212 start_codon:yes stop_codon:yes gene_type:complete
MKKLIILTDNFFTKRDYDRHGIKKAHQFINTTVMDLTFLLNKKYYLKYHNNKIFYKNKNFKLSEIKTNRGLKNFLFNLDDKNNKYYILDFIGSTIPIVKYIRNAISAKPNTKIIKISKGRIPEGNNPGFLQKLFFLDIKTNFISKAIKFIFRKIYTFYAISRNNYKSINHNFVDHDYDAHIISSLDEETDININKKISIIYSRSYDYDTFLRTKNDAREKIPKKNYAVYLDEIMVDHPDFKKLKIKNPISKKKYDEELSRFFKNFKDSTGLEIIVAHHPRKFYFKKKIINLKVLNKTAYLVKHSQYVLLHCSTSVSFALLNNKPLIYLDSNNYSWLRPRIAAFYDQTGGVKINISKKFIKKKLEIGFNNINKDKYRNYIQNYIKHPKSQDSIINSIIQYCKKN